MFKRLIMAGVFALSSGIAHAQQEVRIGLNLPYTGIGAELAQQIDRGIEQFLKLNPVNDYKITLYKRDVKDPSGVNARNVIEELLTQDQVDVLAGWVYSPNAIAAAPIVNAAQKLAIIMNAGTAHITQMSEYYVRTSFSMWHAGYALGEASAVHLNAKTAVVGYTDFPPGYDMLASFKRAFEAAGGRVIDEIPMGGPDVVPDFIPFFQRAKDKKPDVFFVFVPAGEHSSAIVRSYDALAMREVGIRLIGPGDITQDNKLQAMGPAAVGLITMHHYNADLTNPENLRFVESWKKDYGVNSVPDFMAVGGYDGMAAIMHAIRATKGKIDAKHALEALRGWKFASPRGPIMIDADTRDIVMNEYLSEVVMQNGRLSQNTIAIIENVKDACKALHIAPCN